MIDHSRKGGIPIDIGVYIHIPFCEKKCGYCDFLSFLLPCEDRVADYVLGVKKELALWAERLERPRATSLYIGGGTPSILLPANLEDIFRSVKEYYSPEAGCEFTLEANPGTLSPAKLREIAAIGVNRLSLGVQAMDDRLLKNMGRIHTRDEAGEAVDLARRAGIQNISVDLMYGLPGQTLEDWKDTLENVIRLQPEHISAYGLTLEPNTLWGEQHARGKLLLPDEEICVTMYETCREVLSQAGYLQYEISNFARPGYECRHNLAYWYRKPYIGVGLGAASFVGGTRYRNHTDFEEYLQAVSGGLLPIAEEEHLSPEQAMAETIFLNLRTWKGISLRKFEQQFGRDIYTVFPTELQLLERTGVLVREGHRIKMNPDFFAVSNEVFCKFISL